MQSSGSALVLRPLDLAVKIGEGSWYIPLPTSQPLNDVYRLKGLIFRRQLG